MKVKHLYLMKDGQPLSLLKNSSGTLDSIDAPIHFVVNLDGTVDLQLPVGQVTYDAQSLHPDRVLTEAERDAADEGGGLFDDVGRFHKKFGLPYYLDARPHLLGGDVLEFRQKFMQEELDEFAQAHRDGDLEKAADALADLVYVALGTAHTMGIPFGAIWHEVQKANMAKVRASSKDDARSTRGHEMDVVKPEGWRPPDHKRALGLEPEGRGKRGQQVG